MDSKIGANETEAGSDAGYASQQYAHSLEEFGEVRRLRQCGGRLLVSRIPGSKLFDGMGCYPLFCCDDWRALREDVDSLAGDLVSLRVVTDPFANTSFEQLKTAFPHSCYEYKQHMITDLSRPLETITAPHHQRNVRKALAALEVRQSTGDTNLVSRWLPLYEQLIQRHGIDGIARFSPASFAMQAKVPGFVSFSALDGNELCGMNWWYVRGNVAYYHLGAYSERGYECRASYALFWNALQYFASAGLRWACLGAGAGLKSVESGLARFKRGWATETRPAYFCGRIFQPEAYAQLTSRLAPASEFFPAYRAA